MVENKIFKIIKLFIFAFTICNASVSITLSTDNNNIFVNITKTPCNSPVMEDLTSKLSTTTTTTPPTTTTQTTTPPTTTPPTTTTPTTTTPTTTTERFPYGTIRYLLYGDYSVLYIDYKKDGGSWDRTQSITLESPRHIKDMVIFKQRLVSNLNVGSYIEIHRDYTSSVHSTNVAYTTKIMESCGDRILQITTNNEVIYSNDGTNYNLVTSNFEGTLNNIACNPITSTIIISGIPNVYRSTDNGTTFDELTSTNNTNNIKYLKDKFYALENTMPSIVGREINRIMISSDDGLTWDYLYSNPYITHHPIIDINYSDKHDSLIMIADDDPASKSRVYYMKTDLTNMHGTTLQTYINRISIINEDPKNVIIYTHSTIKTYIVSNNETTLFQNAVYVNRKPPGGYNGAITLDF